MKTEYDVAIVGGGPAGSTVASLIKKHDPHRSVAIFEAAKFPRDHVGESLLPSTCEILQEMGAWDKVEQAGFPVKLGGLYRWGVSDEIYPLLFLQGQPYENAPRPASYQGQRALTAFQVDRSIFDKILLDHSQSLGCDVFEETSVESVEIDGNRVGALLIRTGGHQTTVRAKTYVDASGARGVVRKALGIPVDAPSSLRNIAIYDYWQNADWRVREGVDGTNIHVMSLKWGWLWFIAMGPTRTSVGLVTSADYYKRSGLTREQIYLRAISEEPTISRLLSPATRENVLRADSDWSYISHRLVGENWFLAGDSAGFADPILSAGVTLAMTGARKVAYTVAALEKPQLEPEWVKSEYERIQRRNIGDHIRFADYWYSVNAKFTDLQDYCSQIAQDAGLKLSADDAFRWLAIGGFSGDSGGYESPTAGSFRLSTVKNMVGSLGGAAPTWELQKYTRLWFDAEGATRQLTAAYVNGTIEPQESLRRGDQTLFLTGFFKRAYVMLQLESSPDALVARMFRYFKSRVQVSDELLLTYIVEVLEAMLVGGWIKGDSDGPLPQSP